LSCEFGLALKAARGLRLTQVQQTAALANDQINVPLRTLLIISPEAATVVNCHVAPFREAA
jgi:hypothetical protein